jgi:hypothetical protein
MARLVPPTDRVVRETASITGQSPSAEVAAGRELQQVGQTYLENSKKAAQSMALSQAMTRATETFSSGANDRQEMVTDEAGKPLYSTMSSDIKDLGDNVKNQILADIDDPEVAQKFDLEFSRFASNRVLHSQSIARRQQIDFTRSQLNSDLQNLTRQATQINPDQVGDYEVQASRRLQELTAAGMISQQESQNLFSTFSGGVREEAYRNLLQASAREFVKAHVGKDIKAESDLIRKKQEEAEQQLNEIPLEQLGIDTSQKARLLREIQAKYKDIKAEFDLIRKKQEEAAAQQVKLAVLKADNGIAEGTVGLAELEEIKDSLGTDEFTREENFLRLEKKLIVQRRALNKQAETNSKIFQDISNNARLEGNYSDKEIDTAYKAAVESMSTPEQPADLQVKLIAASPFKGRVESLQNELHGVALDSEDPKQVAVAIQGYHMLTTKRPEVLRNMNKQSDAILAYASDLVVNSSIPPEKAMERAREAVLSIDTPRMQHRADELKELKKQTAKVTGELSDAGIQKIIQNNFAEEGFFDFLPFGGDGATIAEGVVARMRPILEDAYMQTGSIEAAKTLAIKHLKRDYGATSLNGGNHVMFSPPEQFYPNLSAEQLQASAREFVKAHVGKDIDTDNIIVSSDQYTRGVFLEGGEAITYNVQYIDEEGIPRIIHNDKGEVMRWVPSALDIVSEEARKREERNKASKKQNDDAVEMLKNLDLRSFR